MDTNPIGMREQIRKALTPKEAEELESRVTSPPYSEKCVRRCKAARQRRVIELQKLTEAKASSGKEVSKGTTQKVNPTHARHAESRRQTAVKSTVRQ